MRTKLYYTKQPRTVLCGKLPTSVVDAVKGMAMAEDRSVANMTFILLKEAIDEREKTG